MSTTSGKEQKTIIQIQEKTSDRNKRNNRNKRNKRFRDKVSANINYYYNNYLVLLANTAKITYLIFLLVTLVTLVTLVAVTR